MSNTSSSITGSRPTRSTVPWAVLLLIGSLLIPVTSHAQDLAVPPRLSLDEAVRLAHENNPGYRIQENGLQALAWQRREAWAGFLPTVSLSNTFGYTASGERVFGDFTLGTQPAQFSSRYNLSLSLGLSGATFLQPRAVDARARAVRAEVDGASANLTDQIARTYLQALEASEQLQQAQVEVERTSSYVAQAEAQVAVGSATPLDIRRAETQLGQAEIQLLQSENAVATTRLGLQQALGVQVPEDVELVTEFSLFVPEFELEALLDAAMGGNPQLQASRSQATAARTQARIAQSQYLPSLSLSAGWSGSVFEPDDPGPLVASRLSQVAGQYESCVQDNRIRELLGDPPRDCSGFDVTNPAVEAAVREQVIRANQGFPFDYDRQPLSMSLSVSIPVFTGFSRQLQVEEASVAEANAQQQVRAEELRLRTDVETALRQLQTAERTAVLQGRVRETSAEELRLAQERFELGLATSIEVVDAQANLSQAERNEITALYDFHIALAALEALVGIPLRD